MSLIVDLYTDGGVCGRNPSTIGGMYAWVLIDSRDKVVAKDCVWVDAGLFGDKVTNNQTELLAILRGLRAAKDIKCQVKYLYSDSEISLGRMFYCSPWNNMPDWMCKERRAVTIEGVTPIQLAGHPTKKELKDGISKEGKTISKWNVYCDRMCTETSKAYMRGDFYV